MSKKNKQKRSDEADAQPVPPVFEVPRFASDGTFLGHELATRTTDGGIRVLGDEELDALRYRTLRGPV